MKGSWKIGTFFGIGVYLHVTFLLLIGFFGWAEYRDSGSITDALITLAFLAALFFCLLMHEYGHALTARRFGIATRDITLLPIGGVARLEKMPEKPWQEFLVAIMGPMVNVVVAGIIIGIFSIYYPIAEIKEALLRPRGMGFNFWLDLARVNIFLVLFNMLPAFPMDGGRVVRSLLATFLPYSRATDIAATLGRITAAGFMLEAFGINAIPFLQGEGNFLLGFIAVFVWIGAGSEARYVRIKSRLNDLTVGGVMVSNFRTLSPRDGMDWVAQVAAAGMQPHFPVAEDGRVVGMLYQPDIAEAARRNEPYLMVRDVMRTEVPTVRSTDKLEDVMATVIGSGYPVIPVISRDLLVGLLPLERIVNPPAGGHLHPRSQPQPMPLR